MAIVSNLQMSALRKIANKALTTPFVCLHPTRVENDFGYEYTWSQTGSGLAWLKQMNTPRTIVQTGMIEQATNIYRFHCAIPEGWDIYEGDRIVMEGLTYEVNSNNNDETYQVYRTLTLRMLQ